MRGLRDFWVAGRDRMAHRLAIDCPDTVEWLAAIRCLLLSAYGAPFTLLVGYGLGFAPVAHAGAMVPGLMPVVDLALAYVFVGQRLSRRYVVAVLLIVSGVAAILLRSVDQVTVGNKSI